MLESEDPERFSFILEKQLELGSWKEQEKGVVAAGALHWGGNRNQSWVGKQTLWT